MRLVADESVATIAGPATEPLTLAEAKDHLRLTNSAEDALVSSLVLAARSYAELYLRRYLIRRSIAFALRSFPTPDRWLSGDSASGCAILVPGGVTQSVDAIAYADTDGVTRTLDASAYAVDAAREPAWIVPATGTAWPHATAGIGRSAGSGVLVTATVGYGDETSDVPEPIRHAIRLIVGHFYENREGVVLPTGQLPTEPPMATHALLAPYRLMEV